MHEEDLFLRPWAVGGRRTICMSVSDDEEIWTASTAAPEEAPPSPPTTATLVVPDDVIVNDKERSLPSVAISDIYIVAYYG